MQTSAFRMVVRLEFKHLKMKLRPEGVGNFWKKIKILANRYLLPVVPHVELATLLPG